MNFLSTRGQSTSPLIGSPLTAGLAEDGGLWVPDHFPKIPPGKTSEKDWLAPYFEGDPLEKALPKICKEVFSIPSPLTEVDEGVYLLELFHGPTAAFKDFGAQFLSRCLEDVCRREKTTRTVLVATSGDTGGAVACAFSGSPHVRVVVLFPKGRISDLQKRQLTCWEDNVHSWEVDGTFDDCQYLVKKAFMDSSLKRLRLTSANSINLGRLLPQTVYYIRTAQQLGPASYIIPSGNLGNGVACLWARAMGAPIGRIVLATNQNRVLFDFTQTGSFEPRPSTHTLSNAMDVGNPSNLERIQHLLGSDPKEWRDLEVTTETEPDVIRQMVEFRKDKREICPHTAVAASALSKVRSPDDRGKWVLVATAHPAKFNDVYEQVGLTTVELPPQLQALEQMACQWESIDRDYLGFRDKLLGL